MITQRDYIRKIKGIKRLYTLKIITGGNVEKMQQSESYSLLSYLKSQYESKIQYSNSKIIIL